jgi:hypothetical protein
MSNSVKQDEMRTSADADEVCRHLVMIRGGAPFLSSVDADLLTRWLDEGVGVGLILRAIERAAESRRKRRSRVPMTLVHVRRHLGRPTRSRVVLDPSPHGQRIDRWLMTLESRAGTDAHREALAALVERLRLLPRSDGERWVRQGVRHVRSFFDGVWCATSDRERADHYQGARQELGDLLVGLESQAVDSILEETARGRMRASYPWLTTAVLWEISEELEGTS